MVLHPQIIFRSSVSFLAVLLSYLKQFMDEGAISNNTSQCVSFVNCFTWIGFISCHRQLHLAVIEMFFALFGFIAMVTLLLYTHILHKNPHLHSFRNGIEISPTHPFISFIGIRNIENTIRKKNFKRGSDYVIKINNWRWLQDVPTQKRYNSFLKHGSAISGSVYFTKFCARHARAQSFPANYIKRRKIVEQRFNDFSVLNDAEHLRAQYL